MRRWFVALTLALTLTLPLGPALAGTDFIMGGPVDNTTTLFILAAQNNQGGYTNRLSMQQYQSDTGPGYIFTLSRIGNNDPCQFSARPPAAPGGGQKNIYMPGPENITQLFVQISDLNGYNKTHHLTFTWDDQCQLKALVFVQPN